MPSAVSHPPAKCGARCRSDRVFRVGRFYRAAPGTVELVQHLLGRRAAAIDDALQWLEVTALIATDVIDVAAPPQARIRQRQTLLGDFEQIAVPDPGLEAETWHVVAQRLALVGVPVPHNPPCGIQAQIGL